MLPATTRRFTDGKMQKSKIQCIHFFTALPCAPDPFPKVELSVSRFVWSRVVLNRLR